METIETTMRSYLDDAGLTSGYVDKIIEMVKSDDANAPLSDRWDHPVEDYPPPLLLALKHEVGVAAGQWLDANVPKHFARPLFP